MTLFRSFFCPSILLVATLFQMGCSGKTAQQQTGVDAGESDVSETTAESGSAAAVALSEEQARVILTLHNRGIGHLENHEWADAEHLLSQLQEMIPKNVDAAQNLPLLVRYH